jgi:hypothetical protein
VTLLPCTKPSGRQKRAAHEYASPTIFDHLGPYRMGEGLPVNTGLDTKRYPIPTLLCACGLLASKYNYIISD